MRKFSIEKRLIAFCVFCIYTTANAQSIFTPTGAIDGASTNGHSVGIGMNPSDDCWTPLEIKATDASQQFTTGGWGRSILLYPDDKKNTSTIIWEKGSCGTCKNNFFIGGPSVVPEADYWVGLADGLCEDANADYITRYYGVHDGSGFTDVPQGSANFFHNLLVNGERDPRFGVGTRWPRQEAHINDGSLLITGFGNDGNIYFSDHNDNSADRYYGNWGIQYYPAGTLGGSDPGGLNFWTPFGSTAGFANNRLYLSNRNGNIGINTFNPNNQLEITSDGNDPSLSGLRFTNLTSSSSAAAAYGKVLSVNGNGDVILVGDPTMSCTTNNAVPHWSSGSNAYVCGIIQDNGSCVAIGSGASLCQTYSSGMGAAGTMGSPSGIVLCEVNGLLHCNSFAVTSDSRFKKNINAISNGLDKIMKLNPVQYDWRKDEYPTHNFDDMRQSGFLAQEVAKEIPEAVILLDNKEYAINYLALIPYVTSAIKEQENKIREKDAEINELKNMVTELKNTIDVCCENSGKGTREAGYELAQLSKPALQQNNPNPFNQRTVIKYYIPSDSRAAMIKIYSLNGVELKSIAIKNSGDGQVTIEGGDFAAGTYVYNLLVDGNQVDSKWMTLTK